MEGTKYDTNKLLWGLLPIEEIEDMVRGITYGAFKYEEHNWKKVTPKERYLHALWRHIAAHMKGEAIDQETGVPHLALAALNAIFLLWKEKKENADQYQDYYQLFEQSMAKIREQKTEAVEGKIQGASYDWMVIDDPMCDEEEAPGHPGRNYARSRYIKDRVDRKVEESEMSGQTTSVRTS